MAKLELTDPFIRHYPKPNSIIELSDETTSGLAVRITTTGYKSFVYRYRFGDKVRRFTIGSFPKVGLAKARKIAGELHLKVKQGIDPQAEKKGRINKPEPKTINDLADEFKKRHLPKLKASTQSSYRSRIDSEILPAFGKTPIRQLTRGDIIGFLEEIVYEEDQPTHANRVRAIFSSMFSFGVQKGLAEYNPVATVKPVGEEKSRKKVYTETEIKALWEAFTHQEEPVQSVLKMLLILGQRKGETCQMRWDNIANDIWTIPGSVTKNGRTHYVPLSGMAFQVLDSLPKKNECVFPSRVNKNEPVRWISGATERVRDLSGVPDFRMHDLRRTAASYMAKLGIDRTILGKVLNHKGLSGDSQVTAIYDRYEYMDEKRQALQRWSAHLQQIIEGTTEAKVTKIG